MFKAISFAKFIKELNLCYSLLNSEAIIILIILRDSYSPSLQAAISWLSYPIEAYLQLTHKYSHATNL